MITIFKCEICGKEYSSKHSCIKHEKEHFKDMAPEDVVKLCCKNGKKPPCDYCNHVYYVYGCEKECEFEDECNKKNNYKYLTLLPNLLINKTKGLPFDV